MHSLLRLVLTALGVQRLLTALHGDGGGVGDVGTSSAAGGPQQHQHKSPAEKLGGRPMQPGAGGGKPYWSLTSGLVHGIREVAGRTSYKRRRRGCGKDR
jgi:hypothetical protein